MSLFGLCGCITHSGSMLKGQLSIQDPFPIIRYSPGNTVIVDRHLAESLKDKLEHL